MDERPTAFGCDCPAAWLNTDAGSSTPTVRWWSTTYADRQMNGSSPVERKQRHDHEEVEMHLDGAVGQVHKDGRRREEAQAAAIERSNRPSRSCVAATAKIATGASPIT